MPCIPFNGGFVCTGRGRRRKCRAPGCTDDCVAECDWKLHKVVDGKRVFTGKTCDMPLCKRHRTTVGKYVDGPHAGEPKDLCPAHLAAAQHQGLVAR